MARSTHNRILFHEIIPLLITYVPTEINMSTKFFTYKLTDEMANTVRPRQYLEVATVTMIQNYIFNSFQWNIL